MKFEHLANLMQNWGFEIRPEHYKDFEKYLKEMLKLNRVFIVYSGEFIVAIVIYYITRDYEKLYKKNTWEVGKDDPDGHQIYLDKMVARKWTLALRRYVEEMMFKSFPETKEAYWHRAPKDRCVKVKRKEKHELQTTIS